MARPVGMAAGFDIEVAQAIQVGVAAGGGRRRLIRQEKGSGQQQQGQGKKGHEGLFHRASGPVAGRRE